MWGASTSFSPLTGKDLESKENTIFVMMAKGRSIFATAFYLNILIRQGIQIKNELQMASPILQPPRLLSASLRPIINVNTVHYVQSARHS